MKDAWSPHSHTTAAATSSGCPTRRIGSAAPRRASSLARTRDPSDRRSYALSLTEEGTAVLERLGAVARDTSGR